MAILTVDRAIKARRLGYTAVPCPLRRRAMVFEVWEHRRRVRLTLIPIESWQHGERMMIELRDPPGTMGRRSTPWHLIPGEPPAYVQTPTPLAELADQMPSNPRAHASELRAQDAAIRAMPEGVDERLHAICDRLDYAEFATRRALEDESHESVAAILVSVMILAAFATAIGWHSSYGWWVFTAVLGLAALAGVLWRIRISPWRMARRVVLPVLSESLAMLAPTLTELELVLERARAAKLSVARLPAEKDLRAIVSRGGETPAAPPLPSAAD